MKSWIERRALWIFPREPRKRPSGEWLRSLPGVDRILELLKKEPLSKDIPRSVQVMAARTVIEELRRVIRDDNRTITAEELSDATVLERVQAKIDAAMRPNLQNVVKCFITQLYPFHSIILIIKLTFSL